MTEIKCIYAERYPFFNNVILPGFTKDMLIKKYCFVEFENCERKKSGILEINLLII